MTTTAELKELRQMFVKWDKNADGHLSLDELKANMVEISAIF